MASKFMFTQKSFDRIVMNGRRSFDKVMAEKSKTVFVTIQGNGNTIDVTNKAGEPVATADGNGEQLTKRIFNTYANSGVAISNPQNIAKYKAAVKAERAGNTEEAHKLYSELANSFQLSFGVLLNGKGAAIADRLGDNVEISAKLQLITTEKGAIITLDPKTISIMEPEVCASATLPSAYLVDDEDAVEVEAEEAMTEA